MFLSKKRSPKLIFFNEILFWKNAVDFWHQKLTLRVQFWHFLTNRNSLHSKDTTIFFKYVDSWPKTLLFSTHTACYAKIKYSLIYCISIDYTICKRHTDKTSRDHSQFACCNQTVTTINKWWTPLSSLVFMGLCVCARILNHNMVKYTLQLCRKEMTVVMEFLIENLKSHMWVANDKFTPVRTRFE